MAEQDTAAFQAAYGKIIAKAWSDQAFKRRLLSDPAAVLKEEGVEVPAGVTVKVVENTRDTVHLILPPEPAEGELSDEDLEKMSGGKYATLGTTGTIGTLGICVGTTGTAGCQKP